MAENRVNAFSPTISPAPKSFDSNEIESVFEGLKFYFSLGITELVVQKKYMGSYCDIYLHKNIEESYFISRNGHKISYLDHEEVINACGYIHQQFDWVNKKIVIIQSELMPWSTLGEGLIENDFQAYLTAHQRHHDYLSKHNLYEKIEIVKNNKAYVEYKDDVQILTKKELKSKHPSHLQRQYNALNEFPVLNLESYQRGIKKYRDQINHYGKKGPIKIEAFNILKIVYEDGKEELPNDNLSYNLVNEANCIQVNLNSEKDIAKNANTIQNWFNTLRVEMEEGIMIKPRTAFIKNVPPALKVRNEDYLTMIYGIHFLDQKEYNIKRRKIGRKLKCSTNDWMINWELLKIPYYTINSENYYYKNLLLDRIEGETIENKIDFRL